MQLNPLVKEIPVSIWADAIKQIRLIKDKFDMEVKIAIVGFGNAGKSTLFNAIFGESVAETGAQTDLTRQERQGTRFGAIFTDTRGFGTNLVHLDEIKKGLLKQHVIIHCINGMSAISEKDLELYRFCRELTKPVIVVITKADVMKEREISEYSASMIEKFGPSSDHIFVSAESGMNMDLLISRITALLPEAPRDAFISKQRVNYKLKQTAARTLVGAVATGAAGVAVTPIPLVDILAIVPMQIGMVVGIAKIYGYEISWERAKELLVVAGGGVVLRYAGQALAKFIPILGSIIGPAIAYTGTMAIGMAAILYFKSGMTASQSEITEIYRHAKEAAEKDFYRIGIQEK